MAVRWKIEFASLKGDNLCVNIYDSSFSGTATSLKGAPVPFETSDNSDDNILSPSRVSTGYIRVVNEGNMSGITPTGYMSRPVTLTKGTTILWQGYIQPQNFGQDMYLNLDTVEFPICDILGTLENVDMDYASHQMELNTFGEYIKEAIDAASVLSIDSISFPEEWHYNSNYLGWSRLAVSRNNWFENNDAANKNDIDVEKYRTISYKELLENIAKQLGWIVSTEGTTLCFSSPAGGASYSTTPSTLLSYSTGTDATATRSAASTKALSDEQSASAQNTLTKIQGAKSVKIEAVSNSSDDLDININVDNLDYVKTVNGTTLGGDKYRELIFKSEQDKIKLYQYTFSEKNTTTYNVTEAAYDSEATTANRNIITNLVKLDIYEQKYVDDGSKKNYTYTTGIAVQINAVAMDGVFKIRNWSPVPFATLTGEYLPPQNSGCLDLNLAIQKAQTDAEAKGHLMLSIQIGNKYWNEQQKKWQTIPATFSLEFDFQSGTFESNKTLDMEYEDASHFIIPINEVVGGDVKLTFYATKDLVKSSSDEVVAYWSDILNFNSLSLKYCQSELVCYKETDEIITYAAKASQSYGQNEVSEKLNMATRVTNMKSGFGILYFGGNFASTSPQYKSTSLSTENALLSKMKAAYFRITEQIQPIIRCNTNSIPHIGDIYSWNSKNYFVMSRSIKWRDSEVTIQMQEKI